VPGIFKKKGIPAMRKIDEELLLDWLRHSQGALTMLVRVVATHISYLDPDFAEIMSRHATSAAQVLSLIEATIGPDPDELLDVENGRSAVSDFLEIEENFESLDSEEMGRDNKSSDAIDQIVERLGEEELNDIANHFGNEYSED
jgi:hypothetical protein